MKNALLLLCSLLPVLGLATAPSQSSGLAVDHTTPFSLKPTPSIILVPTTVTPPPSLFILTPTVSIIAPQPKPLSSSLPDTCIDKTVTITETVRRTTRLTLTSTTTTPSAPYPTTPGTGTGSATGAPGASKTPGGTGTGPVGTGTGAPKPSAPTSTPPAFTGAAVAAARTARHVFELFDFNALRIGLINNVADLIHDIMPKITPAMMAHLMEVSQRPANSPYVPLSSSVARASSSRRPARRTQRRQPARPTQRPTLKDLPNELLLTISGLLGDRSNQWKFARAFPELPQLRLPLLKSVEVRARACGCFEPENMVDLLSFLHDNPTFALEIEEIKYYYKDYTGGGHKQNCAMRITPDPRKLQILTRTSGLASDEKFVVSLSSSRDQQLAMFALLLVLATNVRSISFIVDSKRRCDFEHYGNVALRPAMTVFRHSGRSLQNLSITKRGSAYDVNLPSFLRNVLDLGHLKKLTLTHLATESKPVGGWPTATRHWTVDSIELLDCRFDPGFLFSLLSSVRHLKSFYFIHDNWMFQEPEPTKQFNEPDDQEEPLPYEIRVDLSQFKHLKRVQFFPGTLYRYLGDVGEHEFSHDKGWLNNLPSSLHTLVFKDCMDSAAGQVADLAAYLQANGKNKFPDLAHIIDNSQVLDVHREVDPQVSDDLFPMLRDVVWKLFQRISNSSPST
ncbi:hypothetical protein BDV95DRAFT_610228 [Massariosphaeria phaeospora]|uniref:F-box domain-containing protein n=1 Tax=Massariosphaeria phaeospora TaxID=100035 RepID=A0A7C8MIY8_9PLEO|nr:hypothetical protein BDV95DRAFT_610228 [Massariosphaeria phaeospora]